MGKEIFDPIVQQAENMSVYTCICILHVSESSSYVVVNHHAINQIGQCMRVEKNENLRL